MPDVAKIVEKPAPWVGSLFVLFEDRPWVKPFMNWYVPIAIFGYPAVVAIINSMEWRVLKKWLAFGEPLVMAMSQVFPIFGNIEKEFYNNAVGYRIDLVQHVLAYEWIITPPLLLFMVATTLTQPMTAWVRFVSLNPLYRFVFMLFGSVSFLIASIYWTVIGFALVNDDFPFAWYRSDVSVPGLGVFFYIEIGGAVMLCASVGALIVAGILWARKDMRA